MHWPPNLEQQAAISAKTITLTPSPENEAKPPLADYASNKADILSQVLRNNKLIRVPDPGTLFRKFRKGAGIRYSY